MGSWVDGHSIIVNSAAMNIGVELHFSSDENQCPLTFLYNGNISSKTLEKAKEKEQYGIFILESDTVSTCKSKHFLSGESLKTRLL